MSEQEQTIVGEWRYEQADGGDLLAFRVGRLYASYTVNGGASNLYRGYLALQQQLREAEGFKALADEMRAEITLDMNAEGGIPWGWYVRWLARYDALTSDLKGDAK